MDIFNRSIHSYQAIHKSRVYNLKVKTSRICPAHKIINFLDEFYSKQFLVTVTNDFGELVRAGEIIPHGFNVPSGHPWTEH